MCPIVMLLLTTTLNKSVSFYLYDVSMYFCMKLKVEYFWKFCLFKLCIESSFLVTIETDAVFVASFLCSYVYLFFAFWQALITLKKGSQLLKYGRKGKPKFYPFRLSSVSNNNLVFKLSIFGIIASAEETMLVGVWLCRMKSL